MSVTVALTVTLPNTTATLIKATGTDFTQTIGNEVIRLVKSQVQNGSEAELAAASVATVVT